MPFEHIGLCELGEAKNLIEQGDILIHGSTPVNTDGGLKANGHPIGATGLAQIFELVTQLRYEAGKRQVNNPEVGLSHNIGGIGGTCGITLLEDECNTFVKIVKNPGMIPLRDAFFVEDRFIIKIRVSCDWFFTSIHPFYRQMKKSPIL